MSYYDILIDKNLAVPYVILICYCLIFIGLLVYFIKEYLKDIMDES